MASAFCDDKEASLPLKGDVPVVSSSPLVGDVSVVSSSREGTAGVVRQGGSRVGPLLRHVWRNSCPGGVQHVHRVRTHVVPWWTRHAACRYVNSHYHCHSCSR